MHVLDEAKSLIQGDRRKTYPMYEAEASGLAMAWCWALGLPQDRIRKADVPILMALMKLNRHQQKGGHRDNLVDAAGYIGLAAELEGFNKPDVPEFEDVSAEEFFYDDEDYVTGQSQGHLS